MQSVENLGCLAMSGLDGSNETRCHGTLCLAAILVQPFQGSECDWNASYEVSIFIVLALEHYMKFDEMRILLIFAFYFSTRRTMWMEYPTLEELYRIDDQFLVGSDLLVKPVTHLGVTEIKILFPAADF